jgi:hypothetical protein
LILRRRLVFNDDNFVSPFNGSNKKRKRDDDNETLPVDKKLKF